MYRGLKYRWLRRKHGLTSLPSSFKEFKQTFPRMYYSLDSALFPYGVSELLMEGFEFFQGRARPSGNVITSNDVSTITRFFNSKEGKSKMRKSKQIYWELAAARLNSRYTHNPDSLRELLNRAFELYVNEILPLEEELDKKLEEFWGKEGKELEK